MRLGQGAGDERPIEHRAPAPWSQGQTPWLDRSAATRKLARLLRDGLAPEALVAVTREPTSVRGLRRSLQAVRTPRVTRVPLPDAAGSVAAPIDAPAPRPVEASASPAATPTPAAAPTPAAVRWNGDAEAQAQVLRNAAANGTPFCAVCDKAREELEQSELTFQWKGDAEAQAATLIAAAEEGAPFCEECEAARRAEEGV